MSLLISDFIYLLIDLKYYYVLIIKGTKIEYNNLSKQYK